MSNVIGSDGVVAVPEVGVGVGVGLGVTETAGVSTAAGITHPQPVAVASTTSATRADRIQLTLVAGAVKVLQEDGVVDLKARRVQWPWFFREPWSRSSFGLLSSPECFT